MSPSPAMVTAQIEDSIASVVSAKSDQHTKHQTHLVAVVTFTFFATLHICLKPQEKIALLIPIHTPGHAHCGYVKHYVDAYQLCTILTMSLYLHCRKMDRTSVGNMLRIYT